LHLFTNLEQTHDVVKWRAYAREEPPAEEVFSKRISCKEGEEVVGFHYVLGVCHIHSG
jgi:hypothetical protein